MQQPYGTWRSPITAELVAAQGLRLGAVTTDGDDVYWLEGRPAEGGRNAIVRRRADGRIEEVAPAGFNARTRVHEYGGGSCVVAGGVIYAPRFEDQRIYRIDARGGRPEASALTPEGPWRYADLTLDASHGRLVCVREDHGAAGREPVNTLVAIPLDGSGGAGVMLASGYDFYSTPRLSPDGSRLSWLAWRHPCMPWDGSELWTARITSTGALAEAVLVAGGDGESIYQPGWSPDGTLYFASDRDGWWRLYRARESGVSPVLSAPPPEAEFGRPQWVFGSATWAFCDAGRMVASYTSAGRWHLALVDVAAGTMTAIAPGLEPLEWLAATPTHAVLVAAGPAMADAVVRVDVATGNAEVLRTASSVEVPPDAISIPEAFEFPGADGLTAHGFYYPPRNGNLTGLPGERPPLIVIGHGGPTAAARTALDLKIQFWTSRGFAVADVNYGGSSGYGRAYRERLTGRWGIADVGDIVAAARHLVAEGRADRNRLIVRGSSAGGYTALAALAFHPGVFAAAASYYGICDLEALARETHKFEAHYTDRLVGPYPAAAAEYRARSPIHFVDRLSCALILFQGLDDRVVPPGQSATMAEAVHAKGLPVAYLAFEDEQHGFRRSETIVRSLEAELLFYGAVFGFAPADDIEPVAIANLAEAR